MLYLLIGILISLICIYRYRKDGQTIRNFELYFAVLGVLIWPLLVVKYIYDLLNKKDNNESVVDVKPNEK